MSTLADQPAFPTPSGHASVTEHHPGHGEFTRTVEVCKTGMTYRQWLVGMIAQGICAGTFSQTAPPKGCSPADVRQMIADGAILIADKIIFELEKN